MSTLPVFYEARRVGTIEAHADGPSFVYDAEWIRTRGTFPISLLMPLSARRVEPHVFLPWAANLLPEGSQLRAVGMKLGAAPEDVIGILSEIGRDTAGALSIGKPGTSATGNWRPIASEADLERIIEELPSKPFLAGEDGVSMSLAGVQSKIGVARDQSGRLCIPVDGAPSTLILKPDSPRLPGGVQNEAVCLVLAARVGLLAPRVETGRAGGRSFLLVTRYDRLEQSGRWRRLHQEDFCQALGKPPAAKYEANQSGIKGPTLADMFSLTRNVMSARDVLALLDHVLLNILCCNTDAHAKNYSIMVSGRGFTLAPIYDVMCAAAWDGVTRNLAQRVAGKNRGEHLKRRHWDAFAREAGLSARALLGRIRELARNVAAEAGPAGAAVAAMPAGDHPLMPRFVEAIEGRCRAVLSGLEDTDDQDPAASLPLPSTAPGLDDATTRAALTSKARRRGRTPKK